MADFESKTRSNYVLIKPKYEPAMHLIVDIFGASPLHSSQFPDGRLRWGFYCREDEYTIERIEDALILNEKFNDDVVPIPKEYESDEDLEYPFDLVDLFLFIMEDSEILIVNRVGWENWSYLSSNASAFDKSGELRITIDPLESLYQHLETKGFNTISAPEY